MRVSSAKYGLKNEDEQQKKLNLWNLSLSKNDHQKSISDLYSTTSVGNSGGKLKLNDK